MSRPAVRLFVLLAIVLAAACDKVPLLAPTQSTINLTISTTSLGVNGTAQVIATVTEQSGTPVQNGTIVTFTGSLGTFDPPDAPTQNGKATTTFRASGQSGTAKIGAVSGAAKATEIEIKIGGAAAEAVTLRAEPASVPVTGGTVTLIANVTDGSGNALIGAPVSFSADNGTLSSSSAVTDANGEARTSLITSRTSIVKARVGAKEGQVTINATTLPTVGITASPASPLVGLPVTFTVTPGSLGTTGNAIRNVVLDFGDGKPPHSFGAISAASSVSHVYDRADTFTVTATVTDISGLQTTNSVNVSVQRAVVGVSVTASPSNAQVGQQVTFSVAVSNPSNIPLQGVTLNFGDGTPSVNMPPAGGSVTRSYATAGTYTATATARDQSGNPYSGSTQVVVSPATAFEVTLDAQPADPVVTLSCTNNYPKTCNTRFFGAGIRLQFSAGTGFVTPTTYVWNYGDGRGETTTSRTVDHVFTRRGEFIVTVLVNTASGQTGTQRITIILE